MSAAPDLRPLESWAGSDARGRPCSWAIWPLTATTYDLETVDPLGSVFVRAVSLIDAARLVNAFCKLRGIAARKET